MLAAELTVLHAAIEARVPVLLWGPPGIGKTSLIESIARDRGSPLEVVIASLRDPSDFAGLPVVADDASVAMAPPAWARRLHAAGGGILFLDELSTASPAVQAALLRVVLERVVGDLDLPPAVSVVAAANPPEQSSGAWDLSAPLANRFLHLDLSGPILGPAMFARGLVSGWDVARRPPATIGERSERARSVGLIGAFVHARPDLFHQLPDDETAQGRPWPSPRTWELLALVWSRLAAEDTEARIVAARSLVGRGAALELAAWMKKLDLPDPERLMANPHSWNWAKARDDAVLAALAAVVSRVAAVEPVEPPRWRAALEVLQVASERASIDVVAVALRALLPLRPPGVTASELSPLAKRFGPILSAAGIVR